MQRKPEKGSGDWLMKPAPQNPAEGRPHQITIERCSTPTCIGHVAGPDDDVTFVGQDWSNHGCQVSRIVLPVAVHCDHGLEVSTFDQGCTGSNRRAFPGVRPECCHLGSMGIANMTSSIGRTIADDNDAHRASKNPPRNPRQELLEMNGLVECWYQHEDQDTLPRLAVTR